MENFIKTKKKQCLLLFKLLLLLFFCEPESPPGGKEGEQFACKKGVVSNAGKKEGHQLNHL